MSKSLINNIDQQTIFFYYSFLLFSFIQNALKANGKETNLVNKGFRALILLSKEIENKITQHMCNSLKQRDSESVETVKNYQYLHTNS